LLLFLRYRQGVRREKEEHLMSVHRQPKETPAEVAAYDQLKALSHYNRPQGMENVLLAQLIEKRISVSEGDAYKPPQIAKCTFNLTTSIKCGEPCVPMSKFCMKHIMEDEKQVSHAQSLNLYKLFINEVYCTMFNWGCKSSRPRLSVSENDLLL